MSIHRIRLAGPWQLRTVQDSGDELLRSKRASEFSVARECRTTLPCQLYGADTQLPAEQNSDLRQMCLCRRFHCPGGLGPDTEVRVVIVATSIDVSVNVNGAAVSAVCVRSITAEDCPIRSVSAVDGAELIRMEYAVRKVLQPFNEVVLKRTSRTDQLSECTILDVSLEIAEPES